MPWDGLLSFLTTPFTAAVGWAWETVTGGIADWLAKGFVQLVTYVWAVMDATSSPHLDAEWFSRSTGAPYVTASLVAAGLLAIVLLCGLIQGVLQGRPMELLRRLFRDTPAAVAGIVCTVGFTQVAVDLVDSMADGIWSLTRPKAVTAVDGILLVATKLPSQSFLAPLVLLVGMLGMLMLWIVLLVRESLVYLVVALTPLAWATSVWPALASIRRRTLELLSGLIFSKVAIALALAVGLGALGGVGATGEPRQAALGNGMAEFGTLVAGVVVFGLAAFMPFLVIRLIPIVEAAVVAQGIQSAPLRATQQGMQYAYYVQGIQARTMAAHRSGSSSSIHRSAPTPTPTPTSTGGAGVGVAAAAVPVAAASTAAQTVARTASNTASSGRSADTGTSRGTSSAAPHGPRPQPAQPPVSTSRPGPSSRTPTSGPSSAEKAPSSRPSGPSGGSSMPGSSSRGSTSGSSAPGPHSARPSGTNAASSASRMPASSQVPRPTEPGQHVSDDDSLGRW